MIVGIEENPVSRDGAAERAAELILVKGSARGRKVIARIEIRVAQKFKDIAVEHVAAGLGDDVDLAATVFAIFGVEIVGENPELGDGVEIGNNSGAHVDVFLHVTAIHHEAVGEFSLAVDGNGAGIQVSRGREGAGTDILNGTGGDRRGGSHAGLKRKQIGIAAAIQRNAGHGGTANHLAHLGTGSFDVGRVVADRDRIAS